MRDLEEHERTLSRCERQQARARRQRREVIDWELAGVPRPLDDSRAEVEEVVRGLLVTL